MPNPGANSRCSFSARFSCNEEKGAADLLSTLFPGPQLCKAHVVRHEENQESDDGSKSLWHQRHSDLGSVARTLKLSRRTVQRVRVVGALACGDCEVDGRGAARPARSPDIPFSDL
jgi:hypothetical protein